MFEYLNSFWGGAVSIAGGAVVLFTFFQLAASRARLIAYDLRSERVKVSKLPDGFEASFSIDGRSFSSIHLTELIVKNETSAPLTDDSFLSQPSVKPGDTIICVARKVSGIDDSRASIELDENGDLQISNMMIPIDSSATFEIISVSPIDQSFFCVHSSARAIQRDYGWPFRSKESLLYGPILAFIPYVLLIVFARIFLGREEVDSYFISLSGFFTSLGAPDWLSGLLTIFHFSIGVLVLCLLYQVRLRATEAERRFTKLKLQ